MSNLLKDTTYNAGSLSEELIAQINGYKDRVAEVLVLTRVIECIQRRDLDNKEVREVFDDEVLKELQECLEVDKEIRDLCSSLKVKLEKTREMRRITENLSLAFTRRS